MPTKSVREMSELERKHYSLAARTFHGVVIVSVILSVAAIAFGFILYSLESQRQYKERVCNVAGTIASVVDGDVIERYNSELRANGGVASGKYRDDTYHALSDFLNAAKENNDLSSVFIGYSNEVSRTFLMLVNTEEEGSPYTPGQLLSVDEDHLKTYKDTGEASANVMKQTNGEYICSGAAPIYNSEGKITGYVVCNVRLTEIMQRSFRFLRQYCLMMFAISIVLAYLLVRRLKKTVVEPINAISLAAEEYRKDQLAGDKETKHFDQLDIHTGDEIENLALILNDMEKDISEYETNLSDITAEKERIGAELDVASQIQEGMLPSIFPPFPGRSEFDIFASMHTAKEVGGDFYDFFLIDDDHLAIVMADVSGKGVPAALFMMASKILLNNVASLKTSSPALILEKVNHQICLNNSAEMFVTTWLGILEISTGTIRAANAGHEYPAVQHKDGAFELLHDVHGFVIGGMDGIRYKEYEIHLNSGDGLFLYTDGVTEATNASRTLFGTDRMLQALNQTPNASPEQILNQVKQNIDEFVGEAPQFDDITMLCLRYWGNTVKKITLEATVNNLNQVLSFIDGVLEEHDCPMKLQMQIDVAVEEIFVNIANYAYAPETGQAVIGIDVTPDRQVRITFSDSGMPYNPLEKTDPDITLSAEERAIGGLGIFMVKKSMDDMIYTYQDGQNILTLVKNI